MRPCRSCSVSSWAVSDVDGADTLLEGTAAEGTLPIDAANGAVLETGLVWKSVGAMSCDDKSVGPQEIANEAERSC